MADETVKVARLDHDQVYWGLVDKALADVQPGELVFATPELAAKVVVAGATYVDRDCDLPGGAYKWDGKGAFVPLPPAQRKTAPQAPTLEQAFYDFLTNGPQGARVTAWVQWFRASVDNSKAGG